MPIEIETIRSVELPTRLVHGAGAITHLGDVLSELGVTRPLLVTDPGVTAAGIAERALEQLARLHGAIIPPHGEAVEGASRTSRALAGAG